MGCESIKYQQNMRQHAYASCSNTVSAYLLGPIQLQTAAPQSVNERARANSESQTGSPPLKEERKVTGLIDFLFRIRLRALLERDISGTSHCGS